LLLLSVVGLANLMLQLLSGTRWGEELLESAGIRQLGSISFELSVTLAAILWAAVTLLFLMTRRYALHWRSEEQRLRESERFARTVVDVLPAHVAILNESGVILTANQGWREFKGDDAVMERPAEGSSLLVSCDTTTGQRSAEAAQLAQAIRSVLAGHQEEITFETPGTKNRDAWYLCRIKRFPGRGRSRVVISFEDISVRKNAEVAVQQAKEAADNANAAKSGFLANMSHEIRTPMTAILGYADMLSRQQLSTEDRLRHARTIHRNGQHLLSIINDILDISKIEAGKMTVERVRTHLPQLLNDVAALTRVRAAEKNLAFEIVLDGKVPSYVATDALRLKQVLVNLIGNAVKFTLTGGIKVRVSSHSQIMSTVLQFDVIDTGIGMTAEQLARVFEPFSQADQSTTRKFGGTGLGLTISRRLAMALGGSISVQSSLGKGSSFSIWVDAGSCEGEPLVDSVDLADVAIEPAVECNQKFNGNVLLAEDGEDNRELLTVMLNDAGVKAELAENGVQAVELASANRFDLILMDIQMPELDGEGAMQQIRARKIETPIVALTANAMAEDRARYLDLGFNDHLAKPIVSSDFLKLLSRYLSPQAPEMEVSSDDGALCSTTADPGVKSVLERFVARLPQRVAHLSDLLEKQDFNELARAVHQMKGAAGGYGFAPISDAAARAEQSIRTAEPIERMRQEVETLISLIRRVDGYHRAERPCQRLLLVDDNDSIHDLVRSCLANEAVEVHTAFDGAMCLHLAETIKPDLILLDVDMPQTDGFEVCRRLKNNEITREIPVLFLTAASSKTQTVKGLNLGAIDYITKPFESSELNARVMAALRTKAQQDQLASRARVDALTQLSNRRHLDERLPAELSVARRECKPLSCIMLDIDRFKVVNDTHGHACGDQVLRHVSNILSNTVPSDCTVARYGGEEFTIICVDMKMEDATLLAEELRRCIETTAARFESLKLSVTCSFGVAEADADMVSATDLLHSADVALYQAKQQGRNCVILARQAAVTS